MSLFFYRVELFCVSLILYFLLSFIAYVYSLLSCLCQYLTKRGSTFETFVEVFVLRGRVFCLLELVEIRLYLGVSLCIYLFRSWCIFVGLFMIGGDTLIVLYVSCFTAYWFIFMSYSLIYVFILCWVKSRIYFVYLYFPHMRLCILFSVSGNIQVDVS